MSAFLDKLPHEWSDIHGGEATNSIVGEVAFRRYDNGEIHVKTDRNVQIGAWYIVGASHYILYPDRAVEIVGAIRHEVPREIEDILRLAVNQPRATR